MIQYYTTKRTDENYGTPIKKIEMFSATSREDVASHILSNLK